MTNDGINFDWNDQAGTAVGQQDAIAVYPNGTFCVVDRSKCHDTWHLGKHQWFVKKMPDGPATTERTFGAAKIKAIVSSRTIHSWDHW